MRKCRNWQTSKTKDLVTIAVVWVQVPSSASKDLNLWLGSFLRTETWTQGSYLRFAPVGANPRSTGSRAPHLPHYLIWCESLIIKVSALFLFLNCLNTLEHVHIWHFATDCCFIGKYPIFQRFRWKNVYYIAERIIHQIKFYSNTPHSSQEHHVIWNIIFLEYSSKIMYIKIVW